MRQPDGERVGVVPLDLADGTGGYGGIHHPNGVQLIQARQPPAKVRAQQQTAKHREWATADQRRRIDGRQLAAGAVSEAREKRTSAATHAPTNDDATALGRCVARSASARSIRPAGAANSARSIVGGTTQTPGSTWSTVVSTIPRTSERNGSAPGDPTTSGQSPTARRSPPLLSRPRSADTPRAAPRHSKGRCTPATAAPALPASATRTNRHRQSVVLRRTTTVELGTRGRDLRDGGANGRITFIEHVPLMQLPRGMA